MRAIFLATGFSLALDGLALAPMMSLDTVDLIATGGPLSALGNPGEGVFAAAGVCRLPPGWGATGWQGDTGAVAEGGRCRLPADARGQQTDLATAGPSGWHADGRATAAQGEGLARTFARGSDRGSGRGSGRGSDQGAERASTGRIPWGPEGGGSGGGEAWPGNGGGNPSWPVDPGGGFAPPAVAFLGGGGGEPRHGDRGGGAAGPSGGFSPNGGLPGAGGVPGTVLGASGAQPNGTPVPAPNGAAVLAVGLAGLAWLRRRARRGAGATNVTKL